VRSRACCPRVNVTPARSLYRRLEDQGFAVSQHGLGTFVAPHVTLAPALEQFAAQVAGDAIAQGIDPRELARALYAGSAPGDPFAEGLEQEGATGPKTQEEERSARASLRGQIARAGFTVKREELHLTGTFRNLPGPIPAFLRNSTLTQDIVIGNMEYVLRHESA